MLHLMILFCCSVFIYLYAARRPHLPKWTGVTNKTQVVSPYNSTTVATYYENTRGHEFGTELNLLFLSFFVAYFTKSR